MAEIKSIKKVYSDGRHNAFTDMEYWKGYYYVAFRNGGGHGNPGDGRIIVIRSHDLKSWDVCAQLSTGDNHDDRDPALLNLGDELGVYFFSASPKQLGRPLYETDANARYTNIHHQSSASFTSDGTSWSSPQTIYEDQWTMWQVERFGDTSYGTACATPGEEGRLKLARSTDGRTWETVSAIPRHKFKNTEAGLWMTKDERMRIVIRVWDDSQMAVFPEPSCMNLLADSNPPYNKWKLTELNYTVHCPVIRPVGDELWVAGRAITEQFPSSVKLPPELSQEKIKALARLDDRLTKSPEWHTAIWRLVGDRLEPILVFPSRGDCAYPGLVVEDDRVLMSYYSQHDIDQGPEPNPGEQSSEIFLSRLGCEEIARSEDFSPFYAVKCANMRKPKGGQKDEATAIRFK